MPSRIQPLACEGRSSSTKQSSSESAGRGAFWKEVAGRQGGKKDVGMSENWSVTSRDFHRAFSAKDRHFQPCSGTIRHLQAESGQQIRTFCHDFASSLWGSRTKKRKHRRVLQIAKCRSQQCQFVDSQSSYPAEVRK